MAIIDKDVNKFLEQKIKSDDVSKADNDNYENIYFQNQIISVIYKQDKIQLKKIIKKHLKATKDDTKLKLIIYYKTQKL